MHESDRTSANHPGTIIGNEKMFDSTDRLSICILIRHYRKDPQQHPEVLWTNDLQNRSRQTAYRRIRSKNLSEARLCTHTFPVSTGNKDINIATYIYNANE
ncbi:hypothetical protein DPMN_052316 [Dreissena polymorpha]|uniref:Uncharacterized protein n=1 Tax=Dreissena polymorpha TaxID=45954 RepID=A0A9D4CKS7_DREPO|nr:hypothetical protein DPMN_052316 [Dreissena polymorpha]